MTKRSHNVSNKATTAHRLAAVAVFRIGDRVGHPIMPLLQGRVIEVFTAPERNGVWVQVEWDDGKRSEHPQINVRVPPESKP